MTVLTREEIEKLVLAIQYSSGVTAANTVLSLLADRDRLERERDGWIAKTKQAVFGDSEECKDLTARVELLEKDLLRATDALENANRLWVADVDRLERERDEALDAADLCCAGQHDLRVELDAALARVKVLEEALKFYRDEWRGNADGAEPYVRTWQEPTNDLFSDAGDRARSALIPKEPK